MNLKTTLPILFIIISIGFIWKIILPFNNIVLGPLKTEVNSLQEGYERITSGANLQSLRDKQNSMTDEEKNLLDTYIPEYLQSGKLIYTLSQIAIQNKLSIKNLQYSILEVNEKESSLKKKLSIEMQFEGNYDDLISFMEKIEKSNTLIEIDNFKANKVSSVNELISFTITMSAYGINIE